MEIEEKIKSLEYAKKAVISCLEHDGVLVDMHGLEYWAGVVEKLREEIKEMIWMAYKKFNTKEIRKNFTNDKDYMIYMIKQFGSCGVANWYNNLENLDFSIIRIIFVLLMTNNRQTKEINDLKAELTMLKGEDEVDDEDDEPMDNIKPWEKY